VARGGGGGGLEMKEVAQRVREGENSMSSADIRTCERKGRFTGCQRCLMKLLLYDTLSGCVVQLLL